MPIFGTFRVKILCKLKTLVSCGPCTKLARRWETVRDKDSTWKENHITQGQFSPLTHPFSRSEGPAILLGDVRKKSTRFGTLNRLALSFKWNKHIPVCTTPSPFLGMKFHGLAFMSLTYQVSFSEYLSISKSLNKALLTPSVWDNNLIDPSWNLTSI